MKIGKRGNRAINIALGISFSAFFILMLMSSLGLKYENPDEMAVDYIVLRPGESVYFEDLEFLKEEYRDKENQLVCLGWSFVEDGRKSIEFPYTNRTGSEILLFPIVKRASDVFNILTGVGQNFSITSVKDEWRGTLEYIKFPKTLILLYPNSLENERLKEVYIAENSRLFEIADGAFRGNDLSSFTFPASINVLGKDIFEGNMKMAFVGFESGFFMRVLDSRIFDGARIERIVIPPSVEKIEGSLDPKTFSIIEFSEESNLTEIDKSTFENTEIKEIKIPSSVKRIESYAFSGCKELDRVIFEEDSKLEYIGSYAFSGTKLDKIIIPKSVTSFGKEPFRESENLKTIAFEKGSRLSVIKKGVFSDLPLLSFTIPENVSYIEEEAFKGDTKIEAISFAEGSIYSNLTSGAFRGLSLLRINIPNQVRLIDDYAFDGMKSLKYVSFESLSHLNTIGNSAFRGTSIERISLPSSLKYIGESAFENTPLLSVDFRAPSNLLSIGESAFENTHLTSINLPESLRNIGKMAFDNTPIEGEDR